MFGLNHQSEQGCSQTRSPAPNHSERTEEIRHLPPFLCLV
jgi:hypothetical protein